MAKRKRSIRAGRLCLVTLTSMPLPRDPDYVRAEKSRCTSLAQQKLNLKYSCQKLELLLAANFDHHDYYVTLTYDNDHLPADRAAAVKRIQRFIRQLRRHRQARGQELKYIYTTEGLHDKRLHHHIVINGYDDEEIIRSLWTDGNTDASAFDLKQVTALASYMTKEPLEHGKAQVGKRCWSPSRNLAKPVIESEIVSDDLTLAPPLNATVLDQPPVVRTEFGAFAYIKYLLPEPPVQSSPFRRRSRKKVHINFDSKPCLS